jgi:hypothetical protein
MHSRQGAGIHISGKRDDVARVDISTSSKLAPESAWKLASDLSRFGDWMTIFGGWRGEVPEEIEKGTRVSSLIKVKGFRNVIHWTVTQYDEPKAIELSGRGRGGIQITVAMKVTDDHPGSTFSSERRPRRWSPQRAAGTTGGTNHQVGRP